mmetsp:Transcript_27566/g.75805  ORF Transcript_27566/g.75805 Transcript_27566/m.75805 type:complete len:256 (+) Transcript_27566:218-985(+)
MDRDERVLHPEQEERVCGLDAVGSFGLLHSETKEGPQVVAHEPQPGMRQTIRVLAAFEVTAVASTTVETHSPEVVAPQGRDGAIGVDRGYRSHTVRVLVLEAHGVPQVQLRARQEFYPASVHELLPLHRCRVHIAVNVQVQDIVEWLHVVEEVNVAKEHGQAPSDETRREHEGVPCGIATLLPVPRGMQSLDAPEEDHQEGEANGAEGRLRVHVVDVEANEREDPAKDQPRPKERQGEGNDVHALSHEARSEVGH